RWACIVCPSSSLREPGIAVASTLALPDALPICLDRLIDAALILDHAVDDLGEPVLVSLGQRGAVDVGVEAVIAELAHDAVDALADRKSTRLNSSHVKNSYAVRCLRRKEHRT